MSGNARRNPPTTDRQKLAQARAEIARLRDQLAAGARQGPAQAAPAAKPTSTPSPSDAKRVSELEQALRHAKHEAALLLDEIAKLKAKIVKLVKPPLDPESEAKRQIDALRKKNRALVKEVEIWVLKVRALVPSAVKAKVAKALTEQTTTKALRLDALQAWNALGLNKIGR